MASGFPKVVLWKEESPQKLKHVKVKGRVGKAAAAKSPRRGLFCIQGERHRAGAAGPGGHPGTEAL